MERTIEKAGLSRLALAIALPFAGAVCAQVDEPPVAVNTDGMPAHVRQRVWEKAQQGQTAVIQYIHRTRSVHNLRPEEVIKQKEIEGEAKKGAESTKVAEKAGEK